MTDYKRFTKKWLQRANKKKREIDKSDRFLCLWIAFNGWMKDQYGENDPDKKLIDQAKNNPDLKSIFIEKKTLLKVLNELEGYTVHDMRYETDATKAIKYNGTFESLIEVLYLIRCNLFHGRKNIDEGKNDEKLVHLAYDILSPLFSAYYSKYGNKY